MFELIIIVSLAIIFFIFLVRMPEVEKVNRERGGKFKLPDVLGWIDSILTRLKTIKFKKKILSKRNSVGSEINSPAKTNDIEVEAEQKFKRGDLEGAEKLYLRLAVISPQDAEIYAKLGKIYFERQNYKDAVASFKAAANRSRKNGFYYYDLAQALYQDKRYEEAVICFEKSILINNRIPIRHLGLGLALMKMAEYERAADSFRRACEIEPNNKRYKKLFKKTSRRLSSAVEQLHGKE